jgi:hypothetical protein
MMTMGAPHVASEERLRLSARAQDAKIDVELAEMELQQHQRLHLQEKTAGGAAV